MKVILKVDVPKLGRKDAIVSVSDGYATNYLFRQNLAVPADATNLQLLQKKEAELAQKEKEKIAEAEALAKKIAGTTISFSAKKGKDGKMFGSIGIKAIEQELVTVGFRIEKHQIDTKPLTTFGKHQVQLVIYRHVKTYINVEIKEKI